MLETFDLDPLHKRMTDGKAAISPPVEPSSDALDVTDNRVLLQAGEWEKCRSPRYASPSEADYALLSFLAQEFDTEEEIDAAARRTGMLRNKWDEPRGRTTYLRCEIKKLLASKSVVAAAPISIFSTSDIPDPRDLVSPLSSTWWMASFPPNK